MAWEDKGETSLQFTDDGKSIEVHGNKNKQVRLGNGLGDKAVWIKHKMKGENVYRYKSKLGKGWLRVKKNAKGDYVVDANGGKGGQFVLFHHHETQNGFRLESATLEKVELQHSANDQDVIAVKSN
mmetsp:Transcript_28436/g.25104  ORF Transcript_28436/g.25104 Transcript_28436/m.25104 type:complete len:126 (+) Transcript_28436:68-445(+)